MNGNGWKNWALAGMTGLAMGGGIGTYTGAKAASEVREELSAQIEKLEEENDNDVQNQINIATALAELKTEVKGLREDIQELKERR